MKRTLIISGGDIQSDFALSYAADRSYDCIIAADSGLGFLMNAGYIPDYLVGDFDSVSADHLNACLENGSTEVIRFQPEKDATDTQIAIELAVEIESGHIDILGALGGRIDHLFGNIQCMMIPLRAGVPCHMIDSQNRLSLLDKSIRMSKRGQFGNFISLLAYTPQVEGLTLLGFKYPLHEHLLNNEGSLGVSNEIVEEYAEVKFNGGILLLAESRD